jgi:hypothetical protein
VCGVVSVCLSRSLELIADLLLAHIDAINNQLRKRRFDDSAANAAAAAAGASKRDDYTRDPSSDRPVKKFKPTPPVPTTVNVDVNLNLQSSGRLPFR